MTATWPLSLPQSPAPEGYGETPVSQLLRTTMAVGPQKQRRRFSKKIQNVSCSIYVSDEQLETFESFFDIDLQGGAVEFLMPHPRTEVEATFRFLEAGYKIDYLAPNKWKVNLALETL